MSNTPQAQKPRPLNKQAVRVALVKRGWVQADLASAIGASLTSVNLAINHSQYPRVVEKIRSALGLK